MQPSDVKLYGRDYSAREFTPAELDLYERQNPGERPVDWLDRYIGYSGNPKCISHYPGAYRAHWNGGRPVSLFHQIGYTDMATGYSGGRQHAQTAWNDAKAVGWDGESHITACMDRFYAKQGYATLSPGQLSEYMRGFRSVLGDRTGFYGFYDSMRDAINGSWASFYIQCGARSAHVPGIHAWQENNYQPKIFGTSTDILELYCNPVYAFGGDVMGTWDTPITMSADEIRKNGNPGYAGGDVTFLPDVWLKYSNHYSGLNFNRLEQVLQNQERSAAREEATLAALGSIAQNPLVTKEELQRMIDNAVAHHINITGTIQISPTGLALPQAAPDTEGE